MVQTPVATQHLFSFISLVDETGQPANWYFEEPAMSVGVSVGGVREVVRVWSLVLKNQLFPGWWSTEELVLKGT